MNGPYNENGGGWYREWDELPVVREDVVAADDIRVGDLVKFVQTDKGTIYIRLAAESDVEAGQETVFRVIPGDGPNAVAFAPISHGEA